MILPYTRLFAYNKNNPKKLSKLQFFGFFLTYNKKLRNNAKR